MRKIIYIFLIIISMFVISGCGAVLPQDNQDNNTKDTEPVKPSASAETTDHSDNTEELREPNDFLTTKEIEYTAEGEISSIMVNTYYETGALKSIDWYSNSNDSYLYYNFSESASYNIPSRVVVMRKNSEETSINTIGSEKHYFNEKWKVIKYEYYDENDILILTHECKYDAAGNLIEQIFIESGNIIAKEYQEYNDKNLLISWTAFSYDDEEKTEISLTYDYDFGDNGLPDVKYEYDSKGKLTRTTKITRNKDNYIIREEITEDDKTYSKEYERCSLDDYNKNPSKYYTEIENINQKETIELKEGKYESIDSPGSYVAVKLYSDSNYDKNEIGWLYSNPGGEAIGASITGQNNIYKSKYFENDNYDGEECQLLFYQENNETKLTIKLDSGQSKEFKFILSYPKDQSLTNKYISKAGFSIMLPDIYLENVYIKEYDKGVSFYLNKYNEYGEMPFLFSINLVHLSYDNMDGVINVLYKHGEIEACIFEPSDVQFDGDTAYIYDVLLSYRDKIGKTFKIVGDIPYISSYEDDNSYSSNKYTILEGGRYSPDNEIYADIILDIDNSRWNANSDNPFQKGTVIGYFNFEGNDDKRPIIWEKDGTFTSSTIYYPFKFEEMYDKQSGRVVLYTIFENSEEPDIWYQDEVY